MFYYPQYYQMKSSVSSNARTGIHIRGFTNKSVTLYPRREELTRSEHF